MTFVLVSDSRGLLRDCQNFPYHREPSFKALLLTGSGYCKSECGQKESPITISRQLGAEHRKAILPAMTVVLIYIEIHGPAIKCWGIYPPPVGALLHIAYKHFS